MRLNFKRGLNRLFIVFMFGLPISISVVWVAHPGGTSIRFGVSEQWLTGPIRTSPLKVALLAFERENPGNLALRTALRT